MMMRRDFWIPKPTQIHAFSEPTLSPKVAQRYGRID